MTDRNSAIPDSVVDNFEDTLYGDKNKTLSDYYNGDLSIYNRQQTVVFDGDFALEASSLSGSNQVILAPDGVNTSPVAGDTFEFRVRIDNSGSDTANVAMIFGVQDTDNRYFARIANGASFIDIFKIENGSESQISTAGIGDVSGEWLRGEVAWGSGGSITFTLDRADGSEEASVSVSDSTFTDGGIGWRVNGQSSAVSVVFDDAEIL